MCAAGRALDDVVFAAHRRHVINVHLHRLPGLMRPAIVGGAPGRRAKALLACTLVATGSAGASGVGRRAAGGRLPRSRARAAAGVAQAGAYEAGFDAIHYGIALTLPAGGSDIQAEAEIRVVLLAPARDTLRLDFKAPGLTVTSVRVGREAGDEGPAPYRRQPGVVLVALPAGVKASDTLGVTVRYHGRVEDGLVMGANVHGDFTVFADDWPNRARDWFPSIDHPSDKATVSFAVSAPAAWSVIGNGSRVARDATAPTPPAPGDGIARRVWHWVEAVPIPTYTMVIGAGRMGVADLGSVCGVGGAASSSSSHGCVPVSVWTFPGDSARAAPAFRRAPEMLRFYAGLIGPFSYEKLAHVESATMFGGMENVSAIFYDQGAIADGTLSEGTVAHETAHQWFGDSVTESDWSDLWLSEGFATYFSALFFEHADGEAAFRRIMAEAAQRYFASDVVDRPVVDTAQTNLLALLDANSYQKGAWVLHMLRGVLGDSSFFRGIRRYYAEHRNGNARSRDLESAMQAVSGHDLGWFFQQWLHRPGYPRLAVGWSWDATARAATLTLDQVQPRSWPTFRLPLTIAFWTGGREMRQDTTISRRQERLTFPLSQRPDSVSIDPDGWVLHELVGSSAAPARR
jgi:aminopeptidase N